MIDCADEALEIMTQRNRIAPGSAYDDSALGVQDQFAVGRVRHDVMPDVVHRIGQPGDARAEHTLGFLDMHQPLFEIDRHDVVVEFGVGQGLVDVVKIDALGCVIYFDRLQTGDVTYEGGSRETAEGQNRVPTGRRNVSHIDRVTVGRRRSRYREAAHRYPERYP